MENTEMEQIEAWLADPSFNNWVQGVNATDMKKWEIYFSKYPERREWAEVAIVSLSIKPTPIPSDTIRTGTALSKLRDKIADAQSTTTARPSLIHHKLSKIAASFIILIAALGGLYLLTESNSPVLVQADDEIQKIELEDGTKVTLNAFASLTYSKDNVRQVTLNGEAYFEVESKPKTGETFSVITDDLTILVTGTEFNVKSQENETSVYLDEGKVFLDFENNNIEQLEMEPGDLVSYSRDQGKIIEQRNSSYLEASSWKEQIISFSGVSLQEVLDSISIIYGVNVQMSSSMKSDMIFTGGLPVNNLNITIQTLKDIYELEVINQGDNYTITKK